MIWLGEVVAGEAVPYEVCFHSDQGAASDPNPASARHRVPSGTWSDLPNPTKQDGEDGAFGGSLDTTDWAAGIHLVRVKGTVATAKVVKTTFAFRVVTKRAEALNQPATPGAISDQVATDLAAAHGAGAWGASMDDWATITDATLDYQNAALGALTIGGVATAGIRITAYLEADTAYATPKGQGTTDGNGTYIFKVPRGATYVLLPTYDSPEGIVTFPTRKVVVA